MKIQNLIAVIATTMSIGALSAGAMAQELDPPPPAGLICNGVTCEGFMMIDGELVYVSFPDPGAEPPYPY